MLPSAFHATLGWAPPWSLVSAAGAAAAVLVVSVLALSDLRGQRRRAQENGAADEASLPVIGLRDLKHFDGEELPLAYCCLRGRVYDVSSSTNFSAGGSYAFLAGSDATVGLAKMSHNRELVDSLDFAALTEEEWRDVDGWVGYMDGKYRCVALLREYMDWRAAG
mmetsp:Transcript_20097/g.53354  ORF Transcript_20097/g.53354 Transcript_20097/m.53354 type:complete len:165 (-) Transcript_20097:47-541(-)